MVVSTPQDLALGVATKAINMFGKLNVPILGMVENMSFYCCPNCGSPRRSVRSAVAPNGPPKNWAPLSWERCR